MFVCVGGCLLKQHHKYAWQANGCQYFTFARAISDNPAHGASAERPAAFSFIPVIPSMILVIVLNLRQWSGRPSVTSTTGTECGESTEAQNISGVTTVGDISGDTTGRI